MRWQLCTVESVGPALCTSSPNRSGHRSRNCADGPADEDICLRVSKAAEDPEQARGPGCRCCGCGCGVVGAGAEVAGGYSDLPAFSVVDDSRQSEQALFPPSPEGYPELGAGIGVQGPAEQHQSMRYHGATDIAKVASARGHTRQLARRKSRTVRTVWAKETPPRGTLGLEPLEPTHYLLDDPAAAAAAAAVAAAEGSSARIASHAKPSESPRCRAAVASNHSPILAARLPLAISWTVSESLDCDADRVSGADWCMGPCSTSEKVDALEPAVTRSWRSQTLTEPATLPTASTWSGSSLSSGRVGHVEFADTTPPDLFPGPVLAQPSAVEAAARRCPRLVARQGRRAPARMEPAAQLCTSCPITEAVVECGEG